MPLFLYLPLIAWMGMIEASREQTRLVRVRAER
jgi:hypothetical protein